MSEEDDYSLYERAIYASLSGNLDHILPVCEGWSDALWAHLKVCEGDMIIYHTQISSFSYKFTDLCAAIINQLSDRVLALGLCVMCVWG